MIDDEKNEADGPGEAVLDEPTAHALDPENDPNTEWEQKAADQVAGSVPDADSKPEETEDDSGDKAAEGSEGDSSDEDSDSSDEDSDDSPAEGSEEPA